MPKMLPQRLTSMWLSGQGCLGCWVCSVKENSFNLLHKVDLIGARWAALGLFCLE